MAEDELVQVDLQVLGRDAAMGALQPGLQVGDRAVRARQDELLVGEPETLLVDDVVIASLAQWSSPAFVDII